ncbi:MAG: biotin/lipoyl-binding protein [Saccharofermentans sp.]|nr:biotin/lipoyl-binding protein [Saccharofermentans sp.]
MSKYRITLDGKTYEMDVELLGANGAVIAPAKVAAPVAAAPVAPKAAPAPAAAKPAANAGSGSVVAPMPGTILKVLKKDGDAVKAGDVVLVLEAMKMENEITAPVDGAIASLSLAEGSTVGGGDLLFEVK